MSEIKIYNNLIFYSILRMYKTMINNISRNNSHKFYMKTDPMTIFYVGHMCLMGTQYTHTIYKPVGD